MKILVTGSTGFIGANLCAVLTHLGHHVRAFHRPSSNLKLLQGIPIEHAIGDLGQPDSIVSAMQDIQVVFHAAAWMGGAQQTGKLYTITVEGTRSVVQAALQSGIQRLIHVSSVAAMGIPEGILLPGIPPSLMDENHTWNYRPDHWPYGYAKYLAEQEIQRGAANGLDAVIVNPTLVIGAGDIYRQSSSLIIQVARQMITVAPEGGANVVHVADVIDGLLAAMERGKTGERYILGGENLSHAALIQLIAQVVNVPAPTIILPAGLVRQLTSALMRLQNFIHLPVSADLLRLAGYYFYYNSAKAHTALGLPGCRPIRQAIESAYEWFTQTR